MNDKIIGLLGGMGPEATAFYYTQLIKKTHVNKDQDHFHVIVEANAKIPDRTQAILYGKDSPLPELLKSIDRLNQMNLDTAFITCITSHYFFDELQAHAHFKLLNAVEILYQDLKQKNIKKVGLLATSGTIKTGLFTKVFKDIELIFPSSDDQEKQVMDAIYNPTTGIKSGHTNGICIDQLHKAGDALIKVGAEVLVGGCTEISMVFTSDSFNVPFYDPMISTIDYLLSHQI